MRRPHCPTATGWTLQQRDSRGWRYEEVCISCKNEKTEYKHEKYADKIKFEYEDFKCGCGETFKINKDKRECYKEIERHEKSRFHKLYKMVNDYKNHLTTTIDFKLFSIGQLRAINTYKLNVKEDLKYIITNMTLKKKEVIVKELEAYDKVIYLPDNILTVSKQLLLYFLLFL